MRENYEKVSINDGRFDRLTVTDGLASELFESFVHRGVLLGATDQALVSDESTLDYHLSVGLCYHSASFEHM